MQAQELPINGDTPELLKSIEQQRHLVNWQNKIFPWLIIMPSVLVVMFIYLATLQVNNFNKALEVKNTSVLDMIAVADSTERNLLRRNMDYVKWSTLTKMEEESIQKRYYQGGLLLLSRIFIKYLGFLTGMIIAIVGAVFIIGKLNEDSSKLEGSAGEKIRFSLVSSSPGIIFGVLGTILMMSTILQHNEISVEDSPLYLNAYGINALDPKSGKPASAQDKKDSIDAEKIQKLFFK